MITIATIIRIVLFLFSAQQKILQGEESTAYKIWIGFLNCMAWIIERVCQQFTRYGFIHSSFTGENYCQSCWTSMINNLYNIGIYTIVQFTE